MAVSAPTSLAMAAGVIETVAAAARWAPPAGLRVERVEAPAWWTSPNMSSDDLATAGPALLGRLYEAALAPEVRGAGAHYTPAGLAARLVGLAEVPALDGASPGRPRVWDPACGGGAFLLAAADALVDAGHPPSSVVAELLWGSDLDEGAVAITEAALCWWAQGHGVDAQPGAHLAVADALIGSPDGPSGDGQSDDGPLAVAAEAGFDLVVGNPPFQGQLVGGSMRDRSARALLRERLGADVVAPYTDTAALFLVASARALAPGGRLVLVLPTSVLAARHAEGARQAVEEVSDLIGLWMAAEPVFDASVQVCAVLCERPGPGTVTAGVRRWRGRAVEPVVDVARAGGPARRSTGSAWGGHALAALGVPDPVWRSHGTVGDRAVARAGFRDEYYGLVGHVREAPLVPTPVGGSGAGDGLPDGCAPLVTAGLVGPGRCDWGVRPTRFAKVRYQRPIVDLDSLATAGGRAATWATAQQVPKVVVATQTRVGEAAVDDTGRWVGSTPTVVVMADPGQLWALAAVVCSPVGTVVALAATAGSARSAKAIKHGVASVVALPLPVDLDAWREGADALKDRDRDRFAAAMAAAYAVVDPSALHAWWAARAPWDA
ncbi:hypothetical protein BH23ACT2_BH23ACT2_17800 [soil metagenome]